MIACVLIVVAFLFNPTPVSAASRASLASSIIDMVNKRLCDRQEKLGGRLSRALIDPSKCESEPSPSEPTVTLSASPNSIAAGESTTLTWSSTNATSCTAFLGWSGSKPTNGTASVSPIVTTTYQLDCTGPGGVGSDDATVTVTVEQPTTPTVDITVEPMTITAGSSTTLTWNSANADACTASNGWSGAKALDGSQSASPATTTTYAISCTGAGGTANDSVTVTVTAVPDAPTLEFTADPTTITTVGTSTLTWASTNATSCTASGGWSGAKALSGNQIVSPNATTTYSLTCTGAGGDIAKNVTVNVVPAAPNPPTVDLSASRLTVNQNSSSTATTTLTWTTTNATSCSASGGSFIGSRATTSSEIITPSATTTYMLECSGPGGSVNDSVTVNFVPSSAASVNHLLISEVQYDPNAAHGADDNEWVEIFNPTAFAVNLTNWWIGDISTSSIDKFPDGTIIAANSYLIVSNSSTTPSFWPALPASTTFISLENLIGNGLANGGDAVYLLDITGSTTTVDAMSFGTNTVGFNPSAPDVADGHSLARSSLTTDTDTASDWIDVTSPTFGF